MAWQGSKCAIVLQVNDSLNYSVNLWITVAHIYMQKSFLKKVTKYTEKYLCLSLFLTKLHWYFSVNFAVFSQ